MTESQRLTVQCTPGPWTNPSLSNHPFSIWKGNTQIAATRWSTPDAEVAPECVQSEHEAKANASLIAAAPDLLAVAHEFLAHLECGAVEVNANDAVRQRVAAAIAKALGEQL